MLVFSHLQCGGSDDIRPVGNSLKFISTNAIRDHGATKVKKFEFLSLFTFSRVDSN